jgi:DNA-binding LytR/AlgR family response regulator
MSLKCLIVDDEPLAIEIIETYLSRFPNVKIEGKCSNAIKALELLRTKKIDLMFLDIQMPQITGTDFLKSLYNPPKVIFTTAYRDYALDGFELNAIDYLLKPISFERFIKAMDKVFSVIAPDETNYKTINSENEQEYLFIKVDRKMTKIFIDEIVYLESLKDYVVFHLKDKKFITKNTISYFEELLSDINFLRVHRSYIVSVNKVIAFSSSEIELSNSKKLPIGRNYQKGTIIILNNLIK